MRLALIFDKTRPDTTGIYFERACRSLGLSVDHWWLRDAARIPAQYDLYLRVDHGDDYAVELPNGLRPAVFYAIDTHLSPTWRKIRRVAAQYDRVYCAQANAARQLGNGEWLPLACDLELHGVIRAPEVVLDVAFVGSDGGVPRKFYLQALRERYPNNFLGSAAYTELGAIYGRARIGFNYAIAADVNMRVFEVLAAGALLVTNALPHDDLGRLGLADGQHLILYRTPKELFERIDYFLAHAQERERIAHAGRARVMERHTYVHRLQQLLASLSRHLDLAVPSNAQESIPCVSPSPPS